MSTAQSYARRIQSAISLEVLGSEVSLENIRQFGRDIDSSHGGIHVQTGCMMIFVPHAGTKGYYAPHFVFWASMCQINANSEYSMLAY